MNQSKYILTTPIFSKQQLCIVELMAQGWENAEIGRRLFLSPKTIEHHIWHIYDKIKQIEDTENKNLRVIAILAYQDIQKELKNGC